MKKFFKKFVALVFVVSLIVPNFTFKSLAQENNRDKGYDEISDLFGEDDHKEKKDKGKEKPNENLGEGKVETKENAESKKWDVKDFVIEKDTIYGFSKLGLEKLKLDGNLVLPSEKDGVKITKVSSFAFYPKKNEEIPNYLDREEEGGTKSSKDVDGYEIKNLGYSFNDTLLKSVVIPEGYKFIGQDAFVYNKNLSSLKIASTVERISDYAFAHIAISGALELPKGLKSLGDSAFMDSTISGKLILPANLENLGERTFKGNSISNVEFMGEKIKIIGEKVFEDNKIETINIPDSIEKIATDAFNSNYGDENYGYIVTLWTKGKNNKHNLSGASFYVDPSDDKKVQKLDMNYNIWENKDFEYNKEGNAVKGFSQRGKIKVRRNKKLEIPTENNGVKITEIEKDAFRNVDFGNESLRKYDLESVKLPTHIEKIGDFAFQSNNLTEFDVQDNESLVYIGKGAFMNNKIGMLNLNDNLKVIDDAAFHINNIDTVFLPSNVEKIGFSAFRENKVENFLSSSDKLTEIGEMAFLGNAIENLDLSTLKNLKVIGVQAFAGNLINKITFPNSIEEIREESFRKNEIKKLDIPNSIKRIAFNAFSENVGDDTLKKVIIKLSDKNINKIPDGENFVVNLAELATDKSELNKTLEKLGKINLDSLQDETKKLFSEIEKEGKNLLAKKDLREGEMLKFVFETNFLIDRSNIDILVKKAKESISKSTDKEKNKLLQDKIDYAQKNYANSALTQRKVKRLEKELKLLTDLVNNTGEISSCTMVQGKHLLESPLPIPSYWIGVNVYFDKDGKILYVLDMSYTIGKGQKSEYGIAIENVDEDNAGCLLYTSM